MKIAAHEWEDQPAAELFDKPDHLNIAYVQGLLVALHNAKDADGKPALMGAHRSPATPLNLLYEAVLFLMEKVQPGILGYGKQDDAA